MYTLGIILIILAIIAVLCGIILPFIVGDEIYTILIILGLLVLPGYFCLMPTPTEEDVFNGTAVYEETVHITNNDTIKTYKIAWKE